MFNNNYRNILIAIVLFSLSILYAACGCDNYDYVATKYISKGEITTNLIQEVEKAIEEQIKEKPELDPNAIRNQFSLLLETLKKLQKGEETDILLNIVDDAADLGKPDVVQAFIDIITRSIQHLDDIQYTKLEYELKSKLAIAKMNASRKELHRELEANRQQQAIKKAQEAEEYKKRKEIEKQERRRLEEKRLQILVERRLAEEQSEIRVVKPTQIFISSSRKGNMRRLGEYTRIFRERLLEPNIAQGLTEKQQADISYILKCINKEIIEIKEALVAIQYTKEHPENIQFHQNYRPEHLEIANDLLASLDKYKEELGKLLATKGEDLSDYEEEPEIETAEEQVAYRELEEAINDISDTQNLVANSQQEMQALLDKLKYDATKLKELKQEAKQIATHVANVLVMLEAQRRATEKLYFNSDIEDYINRPINEGVQKIKMLQETVGPLQELLLHFCNQFAISFPGVPLLSTITKRELKVVFRSLVDLLVPDSELVKVTLEINIPLPQSPEEWAELGVKIGFDFIPYYGKELKILVGPDKPALQEKIKVLLVKLIEKRKEKAR